MNRMILVRPQQNAIPKGSMVVFVQRYNPKKHPIRKVARNSLKTRDLTVNELFHMKKILEVYFVRILGQQYVSSKARENHVFQPLLQGKKSPK